ncbi:MAG: TIGR01906 family membrane protein [Anaerolineae bacterium]|nr:TIGR01906 family membrane protein [Anaerolineae bacterium]
MRRFLQAIFLLTIPVLLIVGVVRGVTFPWFPAWEYGRDAFPVAKLPADERLRLARECIVFLNVPHDIERLAWLRLSDGSAAFNERELHHMSDVKRVYDALSAAALLALALTVSAGWALQRRGSGAEIWGALSNGALVTLSSLLLLGVLMWLSWDAFFVGLHGLLFSTGSWYFRHTDTLIQLFPMRFWQDAGLAVVGVIAVLAFTLALVGRMIQRRVAGRTYPQIT